MTTETAPYAVMKQEGVDLAGGVYYWQFSGRARAQKIRASAIAAGLNEDRFPDEPSPALRLSRALRDVLDGSKHIIRKVPKTDWTQVTLQGVQDEDLTFTKELKVKLVGDAPFFEDEHPLANPIRKAFTDNEGVLTGSDLTSWLVSAISSLHGVSLKTSGGFYFVPEGDDRDALEQILGVLRDATPHRFFSMPVVRNEDVLDAIQAGIQHEAEEMAKHLEKALEEEELGARGLSNRAEQAQATLDKLSHYEQLLGRSLDVVKESLLHVSTKVVDVALAAGRGEDNPYSYGV